MTKWIGMIAIVLTLAACGEKSYNEIGLMPPPALYTSGAAKPFLGDTGRRIETQNTLFYATDRAPATTEDKSAFYANRRGFVLRVGTADVAMTPPLADRDAMRAITLGQDDGPPRTLTVTGVTEIGGLPADPPNPLVAELPMDTPPDGRKAFAQQINQQLARSGSRDAYIYVHGYNVDFAYPTLVSRELQHYLGYRGAFISYNWPATPSRLAYFKDIETASATRRNLRSLIEFLSANTNVRRVNLIGYSAGSRLVFETAYQIALLNRGGHGRARLGQVILIGSDLDRTYFSEALADGLLDGMDQLSIYMSGQDSALAMSRLLFGEHRLGQVWDSSATSEPIEDRLADISRLALIDVTDAKGATLGNGHWYFRSSPWASSDILLTLLSGNPPHKRGLVRQEGAVWTFPATYADSLAIGDGS
ncbi:alpha/beta hydrolase [Thiosulfatihalobacter marinus]|uniref:alpha/beta hydrolase n=1 Tax=Thiosulfatihalobacter marinus TaxID=2792481 RepID=UPI0018D70934|nr:alpha/beta hydrolase [Thiosulfatihalobacter marinus]